MLLAIEDPVIHFTMKNRAWCYDSYDPIKPMFYKAQLLIGRFGEDYHEIWSELLTCCQTKQSGLDTVSNCIQSYRDRFRGSLS